MRRPVAMPSWLSQPPLGTATKRTPAPTSRRASPVLPAPSPQWTTRPERGVLTIQDKLKALREEKEKREKPGAEKKKKVAARLQELGPRFTLRLQSLQKGTFDSRHGEFEWVHKNELVDSKKRFFL